MDAAYNMARDKRSSREVWEDGPKAHPCPAGEPPAVVAQWDALAATCTALTAGDVVMLLELARCLADLEAARRQVAEGGAFVLAASGAMTENPWADRERRLRAQAMQLRKTLTCLGSEVVTRDHAAEVDAKRAAKAKREAEAAAREAAKKAEAAAKRKEAAEKRKAKREAGRARLQVVED